MIFQIQSFLVVGLLLFGVSKRREKYRHMKIMKLAIVWDLLLVAQIELSRQAINTASKASTNPAIMNIHISLAVSTVLLYFVMFYTGNKLAKGDESIRKWHKPIGITTLGIRLLTLITSNMIEVSV